MIAAVVTLKRRSLDASALRNQCPLGSVPTCWLSTRLRLRSSGSAEDRLLGPIRGQASSKPAPLRIAATQTGAWKPSLSRGAALKSIQILACARRAFVSSDTGGLRRRPQAPAGEMLRPLDAIRQPIPASKSDGIRIPQDLQQPSPSTQLELLTRNNTKT